jgi:hypothetical protein
MKIVLNKLIYYLEKLDITEEKVRLTNHLDYFLETLNGTVANGRKLGFPRKWVAKLIPWDLNQSCTNAELVVQMKEN